MKNIYFLRHGQTQFNKTWRHQFPETPLSEEGKAQARAITEKLKTIEFDVIISSPYARAKDTAQFVADATGKSVEYSDLFVELRRPHELWGVSWFSPKSLLIMGTLYFKATQPNWHFADEENLEDFHARSKQALNYLATRKEKNILVVSHRGLMTNLLSSIKSDGMDTVQQYRRSLWKTFEIGNCCYISTTWSKEGTYGKTLDGTWSLKDGITCPSEINKNE